MKRIAAIVLIICLLAGCSAAPAAATQESVPAPAASAEPVQKTEEAGEAVEAATPEPTQVAVSEVISLLEFSGTVTVSSDGADTAAYEGMRLLSGDVITTGADSTATLDLYDGRMVMMDAESSMSAAQAADGEVSLTLTAGGLLCDVTPGRALTVNTSNMTMGVLGTVFYLYINNEFTRVDLFEGGLDVGAGGYNMNIGPGQRVTVPSGDGGEPETGLLILTDYPLQLLDEVRKLLDQRQGNGDMIDRIMDELGKTSTPKPDPTPEPTPEPAPVPAPTPKPTPSASPAPVDPGYSFVKDGGNILIYWTNTSLQPEYYTSSGYVKIGQGYAASIADLPDNSLKLRCNGTYLTYEVIVVPSGATGVTITCATYVGEAGIRPAEVPPTIDVELLLTFGVDTTTPYVTETLTETITLVAGTPVRKTLSAGSSLGFTPANALVINGSTMYIFPELTVTVPTLEP